MFSLYNGYKNIILTFLLYQALFFYQRVLSKEKEVIQWLALQPRQVFWRASSRKTA